MIRTARSLAAFSLALVALSGCAEQPVAPSLGELSTMEDAARAGERAFGVPADLVLAIAWSETRWQRTDGNELEHEGHLPASVGVVGIRAALFEGEAGQRAAEALGVDRDRIANDPIAGVLAASYVMRELAHRRHGDALPASDDLGAWFEVVADYAGLETEIARGPHVDMIYALLRDGLESDAADGTRIVLHARPITIPREVGLATEYGGAEYAGANWVPASTSNYTGGRGGRSIRYIVIHTMQGSYAGSISWFQNPSASVSAHYCVRSSDGAITQTVGEGNTAWHAGNWDYNQQSIGIEHEGYVADPGRWYTDAMYASSARLVRHLADKYGIPIDRAHIFGHVEVPGATHTDPGSGWDWDRFMALVRGEPERPDYAATFVAAALPTEMTSGERVVATVDYRNDGGATWSIDRTRLGTTEPNDHASPFFDVENWISDHRASGADHGDYGTGAVGRFSFMITAPEVTADTTITDHFRLVEEGVTWFGDPVTISILVHPRAPAAPTDADGDGSASDVDCDDASADLHPGATDVCGDAIDQDCSGADLACPEIPDVDGGSRPVGDGGVVDTEPPSMRLHMSGGCAVASPGAGASRALLLGLLGLVLLALRSRRAR